MAQRNTTVRDRHRAVIARGKPDCALCLQPIDYSLTVLVDQHGARCKGGNCRGCVPHPMRFEVDHIIPLDSAKTEAERLALDVIENKQASHRACNRAKWHKVEGEGEDADAPRTFVTTRTW